MADGPILLRGLEHVHEHVLRPGAGAFAEQLRDPPEQRFLLFRGAGVEHRDLDEHEIVAPDDAEGRAVAEVRGVMLADGHELVVFGDAERLAHRAIKTIEDRLPVADRFSRAQRDMNERHRGSLQPGSGLTLNAGWLFWYAMETYISDNV